MSERQAKTALRVASVPADDFEKQVEGEHTENVIRKDFTVSERVAIAQAVEAEDRQEKANPAKITLGAIMARSPRTASATRSCRRCTPAN